MADLTVNIAGVEFKNPVITASGTFGFGRESVSYTHLAEYAGLHRNLPRKAGFRYGQRYGYAFYRNLFL